MANDTTAETEYLTEAQAARYLGKSRKTLQVWRYQVRGPSYFKDDGGRISYTREDLDAFMAQFRVEVA